MTELEFKSDPRIIIHEINRVHEGRYLSHSASSLRQLEHIHVNTSRFVLFIYLIDWPTEHERERDELLRELFSVREQTESAFLRHKLEDTLKAEIWDAYWECARGLVDLCGSFNKQLAGELSEALG